MGSRPSGSQAREAWSLHGGLEMDQPGQPSPPKEWSLSRAGVHRRGTGRLGLWCPHVPPVPFPQLHKWL